MKFKGLNRLMTLCKWCLHPFIYYELYKNKQNTILSKKKLAKQKILHKKALRRLKGKETINCVFLAIYDSTWKYDTLYKLMENNKRFHPIILVCPAINRGEKHMNESMSECYNSFKDMGYNVILSYNSAERTYVDIKKELHPDIIFYTNPYKGLIDDRYFIFNFKDILTVYVTYAFNNSNSYDFNYNLPLHNLVWRNYVESESHLKYAKTFAKNNGRNAVITGYPGIEYLISDSYKIIKCPWKKRHEDVFNIIWAPHHTLEPTGTIFYSCFLQYCDFMVEVAKRYAGKVQIAFKPHPLLKPKLEELWGVEKTNNYYRMWEEMSNTCLVNGDYIDLFLTSDAMIHDSGSFLIEYLYVNKPVMRTLNNIPLDQLYNPFALKCLDQYYMAHSEQDIEQFIKNVINGVDPLKEQRTKFVNEVLMPNGSPSQNIIDDILDSIDNQILYRN